ncbi:LOW QUALITY PROTEIN: RING finger protein 151 [Salvelinus alpinus]
MTLEYNFVSRELRSGGYDVDLFLDGPDYDLLCTICRSVLRCPVRVAWNHVFCKTCILQWLRRQETHPCCRKPIRSSFMFVMYKWRETISRLGIKCNNDCCSATFPLSEEFLGAGQPWSQLCPMGCGALLTQATQNQHNCFRRLKQQVEYQRQNHRAIASALRRKMRRMQTTMTQVRRQVALICESLEVMGEAEEGQGKGEGEVYEGYGEGETKGESSTSSSS